MLGFSDEVRLDDDAMWPTYLAVAQMNPDVETPIATFIRRFRSARMHRNAQEVLGV